MKFEGFDDLGMGSHFKCAGSLKPKLKENGEPYIYYPHKKHLNNPKYEILKDGGEFIGDKGFCFFNLGDDGSLYDCSGATIKLPKCAGVYLWVIRNVVVYVGQGIDLYDRFESGYGEISPKNCYKGGQPTNLRMNRVVIDRWQEGISIYYYPCDTPEMARKMEHALLQANWKAREERKPYPDCYTLMYNRQH